MPKSYHFTDHSMSKSAQELLAAITSKWDGIAPIVLIPNFSDYEDSSVDFTSGVCLDAGYVPHGSMRDPPSNEIILNNVLIGITDHIVNNVSSLSDLYSKMDEGIILLSPGVTEEALQTLETKCSNCVVIPISGCKDTFYGICDDIARYTGATILHGREFSECDPFSSSFGNMQYGMAVLAKITPNRTYILYGVGSDDPDSRCSDTVIDILVVNLGNDVQYDYEAICKIIETEFN